MSVICVQCIWCVLGEFGEAHKQANVRWWVTGFGHSIVSSYVPLGDYIAIPRVLMVLGADGPDLACR